MKLIILCKLLLIVLRVQPAVSQMVQCYTEFSLTNGTCSDQLGEVSLEDCCMNQKYGYVEKGVCKSCRFAAWTEWTEWSKCSVSCLPGVRQRRRACYGIGKCQDFNQLGHIQTEPCKNSDCCPENGGWSQWSLWQPCSVSCGTGFTTRNRMCNNPPPKCGGTCIGDSEETTVCDTGVICPTHGGWSAWGKWGHCRGTCKVEGFLPPEQQRHRTCTNPPRSTEPPGNDCSGPSTDSQHCHFLPFCPVSGNWGAWSDPSECSVTCGLGRQTHRRTCDNPAPKYGGQNCQGDDIKTTLCTINKHCPVDGHWSEWAEWSQCNPTNQNKINCKKRQGQWRRLRECLGKDHGGQACPGKLVEFGKCYDIKNCDKFKGVWSEWSAWSFCKPDCGNNSMQIRKKTCVPDVTSYGDQNLENFYGKPIMAPCPTSSDTEESRSCFNLPEC